MGDVINQSIQSARGLTGPGMLRNNSTNTLNGNFNRYDQHPIIESIHNKRVNVHLDANPEEMRKSFENKQQLTVGYYNTITNPVPNYS